MAIQISGTSVIDNNRDLVNVRRYSPDSSNVFFGCFSGNSISGGTSNNFFGCCAGCSVSTGSNNNFFGFSAGSGSIGSNNNFFGFCAGISAAGCHNNFFGTCAGLLSSSGSHNTFFGCQAGCCNSGNCNFIVGPQAGQFTTSGNDNVFLGTFSGFCNSSGSCNVFIGPYTGCFNAGGNCNVFIGAFAGCCISSVGAYCNNIAIGWHASGASASGSFFFSGVNSSNNIILGNTCISCFYTKMACKSFAATTVKWCSTTYELAADSSSQRFKTNIRPFLGGIEEILKLQAVIYNPIEDPYAAEEIGFIAEQVEAVGLTQFVSYDAEEKPLSVSYDRMVALMANGIKELNEANQKMLQRIENLESQINT